MSTTPLPWQSGPGILDVLRAWEGSTPCALPDEPDDAPNQIRFAPGAHDGILGHHTSGIDEQGEARLVTRLLEALVQLVRDDDDDSRAHLYGILEGESLVRHIDVFLRELAGQQEIGPLDVQPHARWLVRRSAHRNPLKFGIALVGLTGDVDDLESLRTLGGHDEFTLFAAVAIANLVENPVDEWLSLARQVRGWGKVHLVERIARHAPEREDVRDWLLRHGCDNDVMPEYLSVLCAEAGRLAEALEEAEVDDELLDGAIVIVRALLSPYGPAGDIDSYADAVPACRSLVGHLERRCDSLRRLQVVRQLVDWLAGGDDETWSGRETNGWTEAVREDLLERCLTMLGWPTWPEKIREAFERDQEHRWLAWSLSSSVGVDLWEAAFLRLTKETTDGWLYTVLLESDDRERAERVIAFAETNLPLAEVATGPADVLGLGPRFQAHQCLDALLQHLGQGEVFSDALVATALRSPVVRNRHLAAATLEAHPQARWGTRTRDALERTRQDEVDEVLQAKWQGLAGRIDEP